MRWTNAGLMAAALTLVAHSAFAFASSGEIGRTPTCLHPARAGKVVQVDKAKPPMDAERLIVSVIGAGTGAWNATLGGIIPAPELALKHTVSRRA